LSAFSLARARSLLRARLSSWRTRSRDSLNSRPIAARLLGGPSKPNRARRIVLDTAQLRVLGLQGDVIIDSDVMQLKEAWQRPLRW